MIVGCYSLHLYCDHPDNAQYVCTEYPGEFTGRNERETLAKARRCGWHIKDGKVTCPNHRADKEKKR